jgi:hypothetical protein
MTKPSPPPLPVTPENTAQWLAYLGRVLDEQPVQSKGRRMWDPETGRVLGPTK